MFTCEPKLFYVGKGLTEFLKNCRIFVLTTTYNRFLTEPSFNYEHLLLSIVLLLGLKPSHLWYFNFFLCLFHLLFRCYLTFTLAPICVIT